MTWLRERLLEECEAVHRLSMAVEAAEADLLVLTDKLVRVRNEHREKEGLLAQYRNQLQAALARVQEQP
jgi:hypothetical protein